MFTKIMSQTNKKTIPVTPGSKKTMPKFYKTAVAVRTWGLSGLAFGVTSFVLLSYVTEWRTVLQYVPYYNGKYKEQQEIDAINELQSLADNKERQENASRNFQLERDDIIAGVQKEL